MSVKFEIFLIEKKDLEEKSEKQIEKLVDERLKDLKTGDLVILSSTDPLKDRKKHLEESKLFLFNESVSNELIELTQTPAGCLKSIPIEISVKLAQNPKLNVIKSYSQLYDSLKAYKNCFQSIELDFKFHSNYLPENVNSNLFPNSRLFYFFKKPSDTNNNSNYEILEDNFYLWFNKDVENLENLELEDPVVAEPEPESETEEEIDFSQLDESKFPEEDRDPEVEDFAKQFRTIYESEFYSYLKSLKKNQALNATSLPTKKYNKDTYEEDSMNSTTLVFYFDGLELDEKTDKIKSVVATSFDKKETCYFKPSVHREYGPYFKTRLLRSFFNIGRESNNFFLDLPIHLYNLLE